MILIKIQGDWVTHGISSKVILIAKTMRKKNFKIQMLAGNSLKICLGAFFEISTTLEVRTYLPDPIVKDTRVLRYICGLGILGLHTYLN